MKVNTKNNAEIVPQDGSLPDVLDKLIKFNADYEWKVEDEVIIISPAKNKDSDIEKILNFTLKKVDFDFGNGHTTIGYQLLYTPEMKNFRKTLNIDTLVRPDDTENFQRTRIKFENKNTKTILNQIVKTSEFKFWIVTKVADKKMKIINIYTQ